MVKNTMLKPPIVRMGGKSRLRKTIIDMLPEHTCYVELFFGAGWVYFGKEPSKVEVVNDVDKELINLFKMIKYHGPEVERMLEFERLTEIQRAVRFLYMITLSFAGKSGNYGYGTTRKPAQQIFTLETLKDIRKRLSNTYVENLSFEKVIDKYDREYSLFFIDPPYFETTGYQAKFGEEEHLLLLEKLKELKGKFILTINDHPRVREWYKDFNIKETEVLYSVSREAQARKKNKELIISNF